MRKRFFPHDAVVWQSVGYSNSHGELKLKSPEAIKVRWEESFVQIQDLEGTVHQAVAEVFFSENVNIPLGSILFEGTLDQITIPAIPLYRVVGSENVPDVKGRSRCKSVFLESFNDRLPDIV